MEDELLRAIDDAEARIFAALGLTETKNVVQEATWRRSPIGEPQDGLDYLGEKRIMSIDRDKREVTRAYDVGFGGLAQECKLSVCVDLSNATWIEMNGSRFRSGGDFAAFVDAVRVRFADFAATANPWELGYGEKPTD